MKTFILSISFVAAINFAKAQEVVDTIKTTATDSVIMNETMKRQVDAKEVDIEFSSDKNKASITIKEDDGSDTTRFKLGKTEIIVLENNKSTKKKKSDFSWDDDEFENDNLDWDDDDDDSRFAGHFASFNLGFNLFSTKEHTLTLPDSSKYLELDEGKSFDFSFNVFQFNIPIIRNHLGIVSGMGVTWSTFRFDDPTVKLDNSQEALAFTYDNSKEWTKSKLTMWSLNVPVMLEGQVSVGGNSLWIAGGAYGTLKLGSKTKMKADKVKVKERKDYHINPLQYGLTARAGYGNFGVYANYSLSTLFKTDEGPELYPLSVGVTLTFN